MNANLTMSQIEDAQRNGLEGISAVLAAMEKRISAHAGHATHQLVMNGRNFQNHKEDFEQDARLALLEALPRFIGDTVDSFFAYMSTTIERALRDSVREIRNPGVDKDAMKIFMAMMKIAEDDTYLAAKFAQTVPPKGRRLSADRAEAARLAWGHITPLDAVANFTEESSADDIASGEYIVRRSFEDVFAVSDDLVTAEDLNSEERRVKHAIIHGLLDTMGENQRLALKHSFGIGDVTCYGYGDAGDDEGLAAEIGLTVLKVRDARTKGLKGFAKRYIAATAKSEAEAAMLTEVAAANLTQGGRK